MTLVKICGITNLSDALVAVESGADMLGFNFFRPSPRYISPEQARVIINQIPHEVVCVGVFVNEENPEDVTRIAATSGVTAVQLHGDESPDYCLSLQSLNVIKAFRPVDGFEPEDVTQYPVPLVLMDAFHRSARGGTGQVADWNLAKRIRQLVPKFILAGGLGAANVSEAVSVVRPYGVDACSNLEFAPGKKDPDLVRAFIRSAKGAVYA